MCRSDPSPFRYWFKYLFVTNLVGNLLSELCPLESDKIVMKVRYSLCFHDQKFGNYTRFILLNAVDLWTYKWNVELMPECLFQFYTEQYSQFRLNDYDERRWLPLGIKGRIDSESSVAAASAAAMLSSQTTITPDQNQSVEPESVV